ncbi:MAG: hypothetical protein IJU20_01845 [Clostridia bacterium]|nr:hypothetical protein [Clostridia bacterium]
MTKKVFFCFLSCLLICAMLLSSCGKTAPDTETIPPSSSAESETESMKNETTKESETAVETQPYLKLSETGETLYKNTYDTMTGRLLQNGYAPTSINGAYSGMFVRDASIQVMSHVINGDAEAAADILRFIAGTHIAIGAEHAIHIMNPVDGQETADYRGKDLKSDIVSFTETQTALYKINHPSNMCAQSFEAPGDTVSRIQVCLQTGNEGGNLVLMLGTDKGDDSLGSVTLPITKAAKEYFVFDFDSPVEVNKGQTYVFTVYADEDASNTIAFGKDNSDYSPSYNYDKPAYNGWVTTRNTIGFSVFTSIPGSEESLPGASDLSYKATGKASTVLEEVKQNYYLSDVTLYMGAAKAPKEDDAFDVTLMCDGQVVDTRTLPLTSLKVNEPTPVSVVFRLPLFPLGKNAQYSIEVNPTQEGSTIWYGRDESHLSYVASVCQIKPLSDKIQVDGNYMLVNAFAMFALSYYDDYSDLIAQLYPLMDMFAVYFVLDHESYLHENDLLRNPSYEHSRDGRYWESYDLITNCFASEALHKMSLLASKMGKHSDEATYSRYADRLAAGIHKNLTCQIDGKTIYAEMIAIDEGGKLYKGFSFVNLAPIACEWYAVNDEIMANTYQAYLSIGAELYDSYPMLPVVVKLDENDRAVYKGNHVIGKGLAWEIYYLWKTGNTERLNKMISFIEKRSDQTYPEVWRLNNTYSDNANQEHANWMLYMMAKITGKAAN